LELLVGLASIALVSLLGAMSPGPSFLFVARISIAQTRKNGIFAALGMGIGGMVFALLALLGLKAVFISIPWLYSVLKILGGMYLVYVGIQIWRGAKETIEMQLDDCEMRHTPWKSCITALFTQLSNPKTAIFYGSIFAALLPQTVSWYLFIVLLFMVFSIEAAWYCVVALLLSAAAPRTVYLRSKFWIDRVAGSVMGLLGAKLITSNDAIV